MSETLLTRGRLLDPRASVLRSGLDVLIRDNAIAAVGPDLVVSGASRIDLGDRTVMPGLIDCHVHVTASHVRYGLSPNRHLPASLVTLHAARSLKAMLMRGFTSVRDAGGADLGLKLAVEEGLIEGPRLFISGRAISQTGGHGDFRERIDHCEPCACGHLFNGIGRIADGVAAVQHAARDEIRLGADQIKVMASGGVASVADPVHFLQYSVGELAALVDEAARADTYVMAHAYTAPAIGRAVEAGVRTIEHGNLIDEATAALMASCGTFLVPTLAIYHALAEHGRGLGFPEGSLRKLANVLATGTRSLALARDAGVRMAFGTDLLGELQDYQLDEFRIRSEVLPMAEIVRSATVVGAEVLRMTGRLGEIVPGAFADLLVVDGDVLNDPSALSGHGERIVVVMKDGRIVKDLMRS